MHSSLILLVKWFSCFYCWITPCSVFLFESVGFFELVGCEQSPAAGIAEISPCQSWPQHSSRVGFPCGFFAVIHSSSPRLKITLIFRGGRWRVSVVDDAICPITRGALFDWWHVHEQWPLHTVYNSGKPCLDALLRMCQPDLSSCFVDVLGICVGGFWLVGFVLGRKVVILDQNCGGKYEKFNRKERCLCCHFKFTCCMHISTK